MTDNQTPETICYTADVVALTAQGDVLLIERDWPPYEGTWALTGVRAGSKKTSVSLPTCSGRSDAQVLPHRCRTGIPAELLKFRSHSCNLHFCVGIQDSPHPRAAHGRAARRSRA